MPRVDVVPLPSALEPQHLHNRAVVVFDVLRATTTMITALAAGAREVRVFGSLDAAMAARRFAPNGILCGEQNCLAPPGFDLGNSPTDFAADRVKGQTIFMCTTNGTRALVAARGATRCFAAALLNRKAMARTLLKLGMDVTLLCSGTNGQVAAEDLIGAGAVLDAMGYATAEPALDLFHNSQLNLPQVLRQTAGGQNIIRARLDTDIDFAARLDVFDVVAEVSGDPPVARPMIPA